MASILDDVHLSERTVRGLGLALIMAGLLLPLAVVVFHAATWEPSGEVERIGPLRPELVILPVGTFQMGSPEDEPDRDDDETLHEVELTRRFAISRTEITQGQYFAVMEERPVDERCSDAGVGDDLPVVCVDWLDAARFCNKLSTMEGLEPVYTLEGSEVTWDEDASGYRLPTEAEWEYAARAGTRHRFAGTDDEAAVCDYANVADASAKVANPEWTTFECDDGFEAQAPVDSKRPNRWQIYDMTGNAWEWAWDGWDGRSPYPEGKAVDPKGDDGASYRVIRGGSWRGSPAYARVADRARGEPSDRGGSLGFRVARSLPSTL